MTTHAETSATPPPTTETPSTFWREHGAVVAVIVAGVLLYSASLRAGFTFDDHHTIVGHAGVRGAFSGHAIFLRDFWGFAADDPGSVGTWRPLVTLLYWIAWHLDGGSPLPFHLVNLLAFGGVLAMFDRILRRLREGVSRVTRALAVAAFASMAIHADVVASATGLAELVAALAALVAIERALRPTFGTRDAIVLASALLLGFAAKESAATVFVLVPIVGLRITSRDARARWLLLGSTAAAALPCVLARIVVFPFHYNPDLAPLNPLIGARAVARLPAAAEVLAHYVEHASTGIDLCPDYSYAAVSVHVGGLSTRTLVGGLMALGLMAAVLRAWRRAPRLADALLGFGASYVVASHVLFPSTAIVADRLFFLPSLWLVLAATLGLDLVLRARPRLAPVLALAVGGYSTMQGAFAALVTANWRDDRALWTSAVETCPAGITTRINVAATLYGNADAREVAWHLLVAAVLIDRYPAPLPADFIPAEWAGLPLDRRVQELERLVGGPAELLRLQKQARFTAAENGFTEQVVVLGTWPLAPAP